MFENKILKAQNKIFDKTFWKLVSKYLGFLIPEFSKSFEVGE